MNTISIGEILARRLQLAENAIASIRGPFILFVLVERDEAPGKWDLLVSAPWLETGRQGIQEMVNQLKLYLTPADWLALASITPLPNEMEYVRWVVQRYDTRHDLQEVVNAFWDGVFVSRGFVITADPIPAPAQREPVAA